MSRPLLLEFYRFVGNTSDGSEMNMAWTAEDQSESD